MKIFTKTKSITIIVIIFITNNVFAVNADNLFIPSSNFHANNVQYNSFNIAQSDNGPFNDPTSASSSDKNDSFINWHKILGWTTMGMMLVTISSGFVIPEKGHCVLSGVTTGLAVATCVNGLYEYGGLISITDGDWRYNTHAIMGLLATAGFITTLALVDERDNAGKKHARVGMASGLAFTLTLGVIYF